MTHTKPIQGADTLSSWAHVFHQGKGSRYGRILSLIERAIASGQLRPGDRLPPQRLLADGLGVDLTTVTRAYAEAKTRGLLEARGTLGTFVAAPDVELRQAVDLSLNIPPPPAGLDLQDMLKQGVAQVLARTDASLLMTYHVGGGSATDRAAGARWLAPALGPVDPARIVACHGAQSALAALLLMLTRPGDTVLAEPLAYPGLLSAARQLGRTVRAVATDAEGMRPDALDEACRQGGRVLYLNPTCQNPTTHTMPAGRRRELARVAARHGLAIIEDDPYWLLADEPPAPLAADPQGAVYYLSTLSKCLSPGLRTAFVVLPDAGRQEDFLLALRAFILMSTPLMTAVVTQWMHDGTAARLLQGVRAEAQARRQAARGILGEDGGSGIHIWHGLPAHWTPDDLARAAHEQGLAVTPASAFQVGPRAPNAIRISLGGVKSRAHLATALHRLSDLLARKPAGRHGIVI